MREKRKTFWAWLLLKSSHAIFEKMISEYGRDNSEDETSENTVNKPNKDAAKENDVKVHYNSPEPEKFGAKAFTKDGEIYLAPEGEDSLDHELVHVYQQKNKNIPATGKINGEKVNTDPKLEKEADKGVENIKIAERTKEEAIQTQDVIQFAPIDDEELRVKILKEAKELGISHALIAQELDNIINNFRENESNWKMRFKWGFNPLNWSKDYIQTCIIEAINGIGSKNIENKIEENLYQELEKSKPSDLSSEESQKENSHISDIMDMLSTEKIFEHKKRDESTQYNTLHEAITLLDDSQKNEVKNCILTLKNYCDAEGIKSVFQSAYSNDQYVTIDFNRIEEKEVQDRLKKYFVKRLNLITNYVKTVAGKEDSDKEEFGKKYWIRSTGSDLHADGEHALFLVGKDSGKIERVYKPHGLEIDNAVVGKTGIFEELNYKFRKIFIEKCRKLNLNINKNNSPLVTMEIDTIGHTEEFVEKKKEMTKDEAKLYFFRAGILKVVTDIMSVIDLHQDNIMSTEKGPLIIDAEMGFFQCVNSELENMGLKGDCLKNKLSNSSFYIKGEIEEKGEPLKSGKLFSKQNSEYYNMYVEGYNFMMDQMRRHGTQPKFRSIFRNKLENVDKVRIVPISTEILCSCLNGRMEQSNKYAKERVITLAEMIKTSLEEEKFIFNDKRHNTMVDIKIEKLKLAARKTLDQGTVIAIYIDMTGKIFLYDKEIGEIVSNDQSNNKSSLVKNDREKKDKIIGIIEQKFVDKINNLTKK